MFPIHERAGRDNDTFIYYLSCYKQSIQNLVIIVLKLNVFLPIFPMNCAHWMLCYLDIRQHKLYVFNSNYKTYREQMAIVGIEHFVSIIPHLMTGLGIWNKTSVDRDKYPLSLTILVVDNILHQQNVYICDLFLFTNFYYT